MSLSSKYLPNRLTLYNWLCVQKVILRSAEEGIPRRRQPGDALAPYDDSVGPQFEDAVFCRVPCCAHVGLHAPSLGTNPVRLRPFYHAQAGFQKEVNDHLMMEAQIE